MITQLRSDLTGRIARIDSLPTIPSAIEPILRLFGKSYDDLDVDQVIEIVSRDKTMAARVLQLCNSALFSRSGAIESIRGGVISLGLRRVEEIVLTCTFCQSLQLKDSSLDPVVFWRHSLACALVSRNFSSLINFSKPEQAYLAGLLHDIGFQVNALIDREGWKRTVQQALSTRAPLLDAEMSVLGYSHCQTGRILAEVWRLPVEFAEVIECHHLIETGPDITDLVSIVHLSDLFCRMTDMGYGYYEALRVDFLADPAWVFLAARYAKLASMDLALFTFQIESLMEGVRRTVDQIFSV